MKPSVVENLNAFITRDDFFFIVFTEKSKFSFYFIVYMPMRASDVISIVTKQNMNVMASTFNV